MESMTYLYLCTKAAKTMKLWLDRRRYGRSLNTEMTLRTGGRTPVARQSISHRIPRFAKVLPTAPMHRLWQPRIAVAHSC